MPHVLARENDGVYMTPASLVSLVFTQNHSATHAMFILDTRATTSNDPSLVIKLDATRAHQSRLTSRSSQFILHPESALVRRRTSLFMNYSPHEPSESSESSTSTTVRARAESPPRYTQCPLLSPQHWYSRAVSPSSSSSPSPSDLDNSLPKHSIAAIDQVDSTA